MHRFANPTRFLRIMRAIQPYAVAATVALLGIGIYLSLFASPPDYQQGETVRIMYVHVPAAWMALFGYTVMATSS
ncbi:MAG: cytochrome c biogenesis protein CcsA, partial [Elsteraceae bacterium]